MNQINDVKVLLFDLGGVLIDFAGLREVGRYLPGTPSPLEIRERWIGSEALCKFESGEISKDDFVLFFIEEWGLPLRPDEFEDLFVSWIKGPLPGTNALLCGLQKKFQLACLSNTNMLHWDFMLDKCNLKNQLQYHYASHLIGELKPNRQAFEYVCADLKVHPEQVVFFDDGLENVEGALKAGLKAYQVDGPASIEQKLRELGI